MLPFTKRPGKDESADVVTKESAPERPRTVPPAAKSSPSADRPRLAMPSISDEEMTCLMPSKALTGAVPLPAAGKPASKTVPPATAASKSVPTGKKRVAKKPQPIDDEEDHRTVVRPGLSSHGISLPKSAAQLGGSTMALFLYQADADEIWARAVEAGAEVVFPFEVQFYGDEGGRIRDPFGHTWGIGRHVEDVSDDEMERRMAAFYEEQAGGEGG